MDGRRGDGRRFFSKLLFTNNLRILVAMPLPERALIERIRKQSAGQTRSSSFGRVVTGIGDDCAVLRLPADSEAVVTTDLTVEGVHFRREWHPPESVGHRCLARGLSDIAAMGARPVAAFLSLALPLGTEQRWVDRFFKGLLTLAKRHGIQLAGGDIGSSLGGILTDITVMGSVPAGSAVLRSGARAGDLIYVTGKLGGSAAVMRGLLDGRFDQAPATSQPGTIRFARKHPAQFFPEPRTALGETLRRRKLATSLIDLSDGLSVDLGHTCAASRVGAEIEAAALPISAEALASPDPLSLALHGGEDYELLFTAPLNTRVPKQIAGVPITRIGAIVRGEKIVLVKEGKCTTLKPLGWQHFVQGH